MQLKDSKQKYSFNPFSGILDDDLSGLIVPKIDAASILAKIEASESIVIELTGKKGRGKSTHLLFLQQQLSQFPLIRLRKGSSLANVLNSNSETIFLDSIHHLSFKERYTLFKSDRNLIFTTHTSRKLECYLAGRQLHSIKISGIDSSTLLEVLNKRLQLAAKQKLTAEDLFKDQDCEKMIGQFGDNLRGIINHLYDKFQ